MMKKIYAIVTLTTTLLIINIFLSFYINSDEYYEDNYISQYYKLKNMPTIIPFDFEESDYDYTDENYFYQNVDEGLNLSPFFNNNNYNDSNKPLNYCYSLLSEFIYCLSIENDKNQKCQKLFDEKINDLEKCELINFNYSIRNMKNNIIDFNLPNYEMNNDIENENEDESECDNREKCDEFIDFSFENQNITEIKINEIEMPKMNQIVLINDNNEEKIDNSNKDCIEYGLIDDHIICTKFE